ncbi:MAG: hypothetical protein KDA05_09260 [Phycisphaerales bacterium]|nr:hypothetical protein [Phycisphaerales bacterium]
MRLSAALLALTAGSALVACDRSDPTGEAISHAGTSLAAVNVPAGFSGPDSSVQGTLEAIIATVEPSARAGNRAAQTLMQDTQDALAKVREAAGGDWPEQTPLETRLESIASGLQTAARDGTTGQKQAASLLLAQVRLAIANRHAAVAGEAEQGTVGAIADLGRVLDSLLGAVSSADAALRYDPSATIEDLQSQVRSRDAEIAQRQSSAAEIERDILLLTQGAQERLDLAAARRDEAARMAVDAMSMSTQQAAQQMQAIHRIRREAAAVENDGLDMRARAEIRQPELDERRMLVAQSQSQKAELESAIRDLRTRRTEAQATAGQHAAEAARVAGVLDSQLAALLDSRRDGADGLVDRAVEAFGAARSAAQAAGADGTAQLAAAAQGQGDMLWMRGQHLGQIAGLLERLAAVPVPTAMSAGDRQALQSRINEYASLARETRQAQQSALSQAADAYTEARDTVQRIRGGGAEASARINRLAQLMHLCRQGARGQAIDLNSITDEPADFSEPVEEQPMDDGASGDGMDDGMGG